MVDGLIAAMAIDSDFILVTRNTADFANLGVELLNPWRSFNPACQGCCFSA